MNVEDLDNYGVQTTTKGGVSRSLSDSPHSKYAIAPSPRNKSGPGSSRSSGSGIKSSRIAVATDPLESDSDLEVIRISPPNTSRTSLSGNDPTQSERAKKRWKKIGVVAKATTRFAQGPVHAKNPGVGNGRPSSGSQESDGEVRKYSGSGTPQLLSPISSPRLGRGGDDGGDSRGGKGRAASAERRASGSDKKKDRGSSPFSPSSVLAEARGSGVMSPPNIFSPPTSSSSSVNGIGSSSGAVLGLTPFEQRKLKSQSTRHALSPGPIVHPTTGEIHGRGRHKGRGGGGLAGMLKQGGTGEETGLRGVSIITDNILIGGREEAGDKKFLDSFGVTHVVNACAQLPNFFPPDFTYLKVDAIDSPTFNLSVDFPTVHAFLNRVTDMNGRALVHCIAGVSRSVCYVIMHLVKRYGMCLNVAFKHVLNVRPFIRPNEGFLMQLATFELEVLGYTSVGTKKAGKIWQFYEWNKAKNNQRRGGIEGDVKYRKTIKRGKGGQVIAESGSCSCTIS